MSDRTSCPVCPGHVTGKGRDGQSVPIGVLCPVNEMTGFKSGSLFTVKSAPARRQAAGSTSNPANGSLSLTDSEARPLDPTALGCYVNQPGNTTIGGLIAAGVAADRRFGRPVRGNRGRVGVTGSVTSEPGLLLISPWSM